MLLPRQQDGDDAVLLSPCQHVEHRLGVVGMAGQGGIGPAEKRLRQGFVVADQHQGGEGVVLDGAEAVVGVQPRHLP